jgi:hypothetical protein
MPFCGTGVPPVPKARMAVSSSFYIPGNAGFQPASSYAKCGLEARTPRPSGSGGLC